MSVRLIGATALCLTLGLVPAVAQQGNKAARASGAHVEALKQQQADQLLAKDVLGANVYNRQNDKIGDINNLVFDKNGRIAAVVIGVGGFLGVGERDVAIPWQQVRMENSDASNRSTRVSDDRNLKFVVDATKDQLKNMPAYARLRDRDRNADRNATGSTNPPADPNAPANRPR